MLSRAERAAARRAAFVESEMDKERLRSSRNGQLSARDASASPSQSPTYISPRGVKTDPWILESMKTPNKLHLEPLSCDCVWEVLLLVLACSVSVMKF